MPYFSFFFKENLPQTITFEVCCSLLYLTNYPWHTNEGSKTLFQKSCYPQRAKSFPLHAYILFSIYLQNLFWKMKSVGILSPLPIIYLLVHSSHVTNGTSFRRIVPAMTNSTSLTCVMSSCRSVVEAALFCIDVAESCRAVLAKQDPDPQCGLCSCANATEESGDMTPFPYLLYPKLLGLFSKGMELKHYMHFFIW